MRKMRVFPRYPLEPRMLSFTGLFLYLKILLRPFAKIGFKTYPLIEVVKNPD